jgi:hypothetical protein
VVAVGGAVGGYFIYQKMNNNNIYDKYSITFTATNVDSSQSASPLIVQHAPTPDIPDNSKVHFEATIKQGDKVLTNLDNVTITIQLGTQKLTIDEFNQQYNPDLVIETPI